MSTIGEVYDPLIAAAVADDEDGHRLLREAGERIFENNPDRCSDIEDGVAAAKHNLGYYVQYSSDEVAAKVKAFYGLDPAYQPLLATRSPSP